MSDLSGISYPMCTAAACFHHSAILNPKDIQLLPALTEKINHKMCFKTLDHLMKECSCVAPLWQIVMNGHTPDQGDDCAAWLLDTLAHGETLFKLRAVAVWWCIWRARNETVWNNKPWQLSSVVHEVYRCVGDWQNLMSGAPALGAGTYVLQNAVTGQDDAVHLWKHDMWRERFVGDSIAGERIERLMESDRRIWIEIGVDGRMLFEIVERGWRKLGASAEMGRSGVGNHDNCKEGGSVVRDSSAEENGAAGRMV
nr:uncharacterized protein LOC109159406 [Ipomoea batatas]